MNSLTKLTLLLTLFLSVLVPARAETVTFLLENKVLNQTFSFKLELPTGFEATRREGPDFDFFEIHKNANVYLAIYAGGHPNFPHEHIDGSEASYMNICVDDAKLREKVHSNPSEQMRVLSEWKDGKLVHRELLVRYSLGGGWPNYVHAITTSHLSAAEMQIADKLLFTIQLKPEDSGKVEGQQ